MPHICNIWHNCRTYDIENATMCGKQAEQERLRETLKAQEEAIREAITKDNKKDNKQSSKDRLLSLRLLFVR